MSHGLGGGRRLRLLHSPGSGPGCVGDVPAAIAAAARALLAHRPPLCPVVACRVVDGKKVRFLKKTGEVLPERLPEKKAEPKAE